jgi:hypothetical protein
MAWCLRSCGYPSTSWIKEGIRVELHPMNIGDSGGVVEILWAAGGLLVYLFIIALITSLFGQSSTQDRRAKDRRQQTEDRRRSSRNFGRGDRRVKERRSIYRGLPA